MSIRSGRSMNFRLAEHFWLKEFVCKGCYKENKAKTYQHALKYIDNLSQIAQLLENMRMILKKPIIINSGLRCEKHNREIGGAKRSAHLEGLAVDISCRNPHDRYKFIVMGLFFDFRRIGIYPTWIHMDKKSKKRIFYYGIIKKRR